MIKMNLRTVVSKCWPKVIVQRALSHINDNSALSWSILVRKDPSQPLRCNVRRQICFRTFIGSSVSDFSRTFQFSLSRYFPYPSGLFNNPSGFGSSRYHYFPCSCYILRPNLYYVRSIIVKLAALISICVTEHVARRILFYKNRV